MFSFLSKLFKKKQQPEVSYPIFTAKIQSDAPLKSPASQIIFQTPIEHTLAEEIVIKNRGELNLLCKSKGGEFIYLPEYSQSILHNDKGYYNNPTRTWILKSNNVNWNNLLLNHLVRGTIHQPCLLACVMYDSTSKVYTFKGISLSGDSKKDILSKIKWFCRKYSHPRPESHYNDDNNICFRLARNPDGSFPTLPKESVDETFSSDIEKMIRSARKCVEKLRFEGIDELVLRELVLGKPKLSRLVVTKDKKILLPDYNNMEIHMSPLPKAVYLLFLNHPEGILLKDLANYYDELFYLYRETTDRIDTNYLILSLQMLTDPIDNSINEKCARIKEAFLSKFNDELAKYYYISSEGAGKPKRILLSRDLIEIR